MSTPKRSTGASAQTALSSALAAHGSARIEGLVRLSREHPEFAPVWIALAEEHLKARRKEEALTAAKRALKLDFNAHQRFSPELKEVSRSLIPERKREPLPEAPAAPAAVMARVPAPRPGPPGTSEPAAQALQQASILVGYHRRTRLEELSREYPDHAPIWVALAEETLAQRSVEQAMDAAERAISLDPSLEAVMSPPLVRAWKYHRKEQRRYTPPSNARAAEPEQAAANAQVAISETPSSQTAPSAVVAPSETRPPIKPGVQKMLATALGLRSRPERITVLEQLRAMDPTSDDVLFHLAKELALANRLDDARRAGDQLRELAPERYNELYTWAAAHWASQTQAQAEPEPEPRPQPSALTRALQGLDAELTVNPPVPALPPTPSTQNMPTPAPPPNMRAGIAPLHAADEDVEPTIRVSRPPESLAMPASEAVIGRMTPGASSMSGLEHGQENAAFKTVAMNLSDMQRLADETRVSPAHPSSYPGAPVEPDDTRLAIPSTPTPDKPPVRARIRQAPPDTYVDARPLGRPRVADPAPDTELQFRPPERKPDEFDTSRVNLDEVLDDDRSTTMPPWLNNPRPWAATGHSTPDATPRSNNIERAPSPVMPAHSSLAARPTTPVPADLRTSDAPNATAPRPQAPNQRAHPRLVPNRKRSPNSSDES